jgi:hypothetical protein
MQSMRRQRLFFHTQPVRTLIEAVILGVITSIALLVLQLFLLPARWQLSLNVLFGVICVLLFVLRLRVPRVFLKAGEFL